MKEQELIKMRNKVNGNSDGITVLIRQLQVMEQMVGLQMEVLKAMEGYEEAEKKVLEAIENSSKDATANANTEV
jgi:hypothetical protein